MAEKNTGMQKLNVDYTEYETNLPRTFFARKAWEREDHRQIKAFLPAVIVEILVKPGDQVETGQRLMVIEAMKMRNNVFSPCSGRVVSVPVKSGDRVMKKQLLVRLE